MTYYFRIEKFINIKEEEEIKKTQLNQKFELLAVCFLIFQSAKNATI